MIWDLPLSWALGSTFCFLILIIELGFPETNQIVVLQTLSLKQAVLEWIWGFYGGYRFSAIGIPPNDWAIHIGDELALQGRSSKPAQRRCHCANYLPFYVNEISSRMEVYQQRIYKVLRFGHPPGRFET